MFYTIDRRPETVQKLGRPAIEAHSLLAAAKGRAAADTGIHRITTADARRFVKLHYGMALEDALAKGLV